MEQRQRVLIVEDNLEQRDELLRPLQKLPAPLFIQSVTNLEDAEMLLQESIIDSDFFQLFLLDIHLSNDEDNLEGFDFAQLLRSYTVYNMTPLIFLTSNEQQVEFALNNFHCYNYIKKPYDSDEVAKQVQHLLLSRIVQQETFIIRDTRRIAHRVAKDSILFLESDGHTVKIVCQNNTIVSRDYSLTAMEALLGTGFLRCHRKYVVNVKLIKNYDNLCSNIQIQDHSIPVGRVFKDKLLEKMQLI